MREGYCTCLVCVCVSVRNSLLLVFSNTARQGGEIATQTASLQQYLDFKNGDFSKIAALKRKASKQAYMQISKNVPDQTLPCLVCFRKIKSNI